MNICIETENQNLFKVIDLAWSYLDKIVVLHDASILNDSEAVQKSLHIISMNNLEDVESLSLLPHQKKMAFIKNRWYELDDLRRNYIDKEIREHYFMERLADIIWDTAIIEAEMEEEEERKRVEKEFFGN